VRRRSVKCLVCERRFTPARRDARYCSPACRQRAHRGRSQQDDLHREIEATRRRYWQLVAQLNAHDGDQAVTNLSQLVTENGDVYMHGKLVGQTTPHRPGWAAWGLEAAGPPFMPPPAGPPKSVRP
jgi:hypothetical protein